MFYPQSDVVNHYGGLTRAGELPPHYIHPQVLQYQYLRAQQEVLTAPRIAYHVPGARSPHLPLDPKLEAGGEESHSPPLELRRATRTPQDRTTDSPQVAQVYMLHGARLPPPIAQYSPAANPPLAGAPTGPRGGYYEPPPAHIRTQYPMAGSEAPTDRAITPERPRKHQVATPPHASQVPPQADSLLMLLQRYPVMWQGLLALKNDQAAVQMHFVFGNPNVARDSLPCHSDGSTPPLRIAQRMRLEQTQLDGVARKMQVSLRKKNSMKKKNNNKKTQRNVARIVLSRWVFRLFVHRPTTSTACYSPFPAVATTWTFCSRAKIYRPDS